MQHRPLGKTGLLVSEIGYGAWGIGGSGWIGAQEDESVRALRRAIELGVNFIDTARGYGESERIVGQVVREHPGDPLYVATKVPPKNRIWPAPDGIHPAEAFPGDHIRASLETSLRVSGLEAFDLLQFHVWSDEWMGRGDWLETIEDLRREGKIRFFGVSVNDYQPGNVLDLVRSGHADAIQVIYNAFHQAPEEELLPACAQHGVGVIVRVALDEGGLTGRITPGTTFPAGDFRNSYFGGDRKTQVKQHADALTADLGISDGQLAEVALRYVLSDEAVSTVIAGMRTVQNVERNTAVGDGRGLDPAQRDIVARHRWERNFYQS
ncbi:MAG TPA: aldo/keto reductase [Streptosporangiaceae bacterium]|nr:aldo/keto reductase [Streptosporangiaceae bacterium]